MRTATLALGAEQPKHHRTRLAALLAIILTALLALTAPQSTAPAQAASSFAKGADISWVPGMEAQGYTWKDRWGTTRDVLDILRWDYGIESARIRVWVNPSNDYANGYLNATRAAQLAQRAQNKGMRVMLTLHYSDSWADPGQQTKPAAWSNFTNQQLMDNIWTYTRSVLTTMQNYGVTPEWVQIGNETNDGMLWPNGRASTGTTAMRNYAYFVTTGHNAVKSINSNIKTIVHLANGNDAALYTWNIGGIIAQGAQFDAIGMSLYPTASNWSSYVDAAAWNMQNLKNLYGKDVIVSEIGLEYNQATATKNFITKTIQSTSAAGGLGVFYWEPAATPGYNGGYNKGAWGTNGRPTSALEGFWTNP